MQDSPDRMHNAEGSATNGTFIDDTLSRLTCDVRGSSAMAIRHAPFSFPSSLCNKGDGFAWGKLEETRRELSSMMRFCPRLPSPSPRTTATQAKYHRGASMSSSRPRVEEGKSPENRQLSSSAGDSTQKGAKKSMPPPSTPLFSSHRKEVMQSGEGDDEATSAAWPLRCAPAGLDRRSPSARSQLFPPNSPSRLHLNATLLFNTNLNPANSANGTSLVPSPSSPPPKRPLISSSGLFVCERDALSPRRNFAISNSKLEIHRPTPPLPISKQCTPRCSKTSRRRGSSSGILQLSPFLLSHDASSLQPPPHPRDSRPSACGSPPSSPPYLRVVHTSRTRLSDQNTSYSCSTGEGKDKSIAPNGDDNDDDGSKCLSLAYSVGRKDTRHHFVRQNILSLSSSAINSPHPRLKKVSDCGGRPATAPPPPPSHVPSQLIPEGPITTVSIHTIGQGNLLIEFSRA